MEILENSYFKKPILTLLNTLFIMRSDGIITIKRLKKHNPQIHYYIRVINKCLI